MFHSCDLCYFILCNLSFISTVRSQKYRNVILLITEFEFLQSGFVASSEVDWLNIFPFWGLKIHFGLYVFTLSLFYIFYIVCTNNLEEFQFHPRLRNAQTSSCLTHQKCSALYLCILYVIFTRSTWTVKNSFHLRWHAHWNWTFLPLFLVIRDLTLCFVA